MGSRGPVPKRSQERRRRNKVDTDTVTIDGAVRAPRAEKDWHPIAKGWFNSLKKSGQSAFYEPSDWQLARYVASAMTTNLKAGKFSAQLFQSVVAAMTELLTSEGARRRIRLEIQREVGDEDLAPVSVMDEYRDALGG
jgi:hypothetical protein